MRLTIGVPVYNGAKHIRECLECLVNQSRQDFRIVISDNASTDGTSDICSEFAGQFDNVTHHRHNRTSDVLTNFGWLLENSTDELFMWRAYDDLSSLDYVERLREKFADPGCRLAVGQVETRREKPDGSLKLRYAPVPRCLDQRQGVVSVANCLMKAHPSWVYGLWKRKALFDAFEAVKAEYGDPWGWDHLALLPVLLGRAVRAEPQVTFVQRLGITRGPSNEHSSKFLARRYKAKQLLHKQIQEADLHMLERWTATTLSPWWLDKRIHSRSKLLKMRLRRS
jgi:glycosyltransferase involved in cell wall biosynthesis